MWDLLRKGSTEIGLSISDDFTSDPSSDIFLAEQEPIKGIDH
jgi:hypothetical protein